MARIRTIKPEFFRHEALFEAEQADNLPLRLAYIGLWTVADREGRFKWQPRALKLDCLPYDVIDFSKILDALAVHKFIVKYEVDGEFFGFIPSWESHQVINIREAKSTLPEPSSETHVRAHACTSISSLTPNGVNVPKGLRETVYAKDGHRCVRCSAVDDLTIDHIFPQSLGGTHAITNLRTLCRSCNSARPVSGQRLLDDLAKDGLTMQDMQRMCMHVHAQGEGKGREEEGEGKGNTCDDAKASPRPIPAESKRAAKPKSQKPESEEKPGRTAFAAYALAYVERYGSEPPQNAKTNSLFVQLVQRIGATEAPRVAGWYVKNENLPFYVQRSHPVDALVRDCEGMLTRMRRGTPAIAQRGTFRPVGVELEQRNKDAVSEFLASSAKDITPEVGHG